GCQRDSLMRWSQREADPAEIDLSGKKFGGKRPAFAIKTTRCSCRLAAIFGCNWTIEWQFDRLNFGGRRCREPAHLHRKRTQLIGVERGYQCSTDDSGFLEWHLLCINLTSRDQR